MNEDSDYKIKPIILKTLLGYIYLDYNEIILIQAKGHYTLVYTIKRENPFKTLHNITFIEKNYCNIHLYRCHRSFIVNLTQINELAVKEHKLYLKNNLEAPISEEGMKFFKRMFANHEDHNYF